MRRARLTAILPTIAAVAALLPAGIAQADPARTPVTDPLNSGTPHGSITLPPNRCGFPIEVAVVVNKEYQTVTTLADGTTITDIRGDLVVSFTNDITDKTIIRNVSGPTTETDNLDGKTGRKVYEGNNFLAFGPLSQQHIPADEPHLVFTSGPVAVSFATTDDGRRYVTSLSHTGHQVDGCTLLQG